MTPIGIVVIGRNEGNRLVQCLDSVLQQATLVVYVDSGSTDHSVSMARGKGVHVVELAHPVYSGPRTKRRRCTVNAACARPCLCTVCRWRL